VSWIRLFNYLLSQRLMGVQIPDSMNTHATWKGG
jgi:hypothetical protein